MTVDDLRIPGSQASPCIPVSQIIKDYSLSSALLSLSHKTHLPHTSVDKPRPFSPDPLLHSLRFKLNTQDSLFSTDFRVGPIDFHPQA